MRHEHQRYVRIARDIFAEFKQVAVDFGLLFGGVVGFLHAEGDEAGQVVENVTGQQDFGPLAQRLIQIEQLAASWLKKAFGSPTIFISFLLGCNVSNHYQAGRLF